MLGASEHPVPGTAALAAGSLPAPVAGGGGRRMRSGPGAAAVQGAGHRRQPPLPKMLGLKEGEK